MASNSPSRMQACEIRKATTTARRGSLFGPLPTAKNRSDSKTLSRANACRMRGAPIMLPSAEESVAANTPAVISRGQRAISAITSVPSPKASAGMTEPSSTAWLK